ncbi:MAG TPA: alpha/beta hydrolase-fold protein [Vicinamibacteria bacterium]|nr:alpha/beta hydrolase-fold protein [Vicinamibacteria bacterium]
MQRVSSMLLLALAFPAQGEVRTANVPSPSLGRDVGAIIQLPPSYERSPGRRYPYLVALHGLFESQSFWERRGLAALLERLWAEGKVPELVVVAVDGGNSFFVNTAGGRYEDLVTSDLPAWVESNLRVRTGREARGLWGVSMGGYAALRIALAHPEVFFAVNTHSAMLLEGIPTREAGAGRWQMDAFHRVFGDPVEPSLWAANDPLRLAAKADGNGAPALRFDCGAQDRYGLAKGNEALHRALDAHSVKHTFALPPGDHGYEYVLSVAEEGLHFLGGALTVKASR